MTDQSRIFWSELMTTEPETAKAFYAGTLGVTVEEFDVPKVGRIAILIDPTGALIGWMKPDPRQPA